MGTLLLSTLLAIGLIGTIHLHADAPKEGVLAKDFDFPLCMAGKKLGSVSLKAGRNINIIKVQDDGVLISRGEADPVKVSKEMLTPESLAAVTSTPSPAPTPSPPPIPSPAPIPATPVATNLGTAVANQEITFLAHGAFGFPQEQSIILCDRADLRFSVCNDEEYLWAQAVVWDDDGDGLRLVYNNQLIGDHSDLLIDVDADKAATPYVDRVFMLNPWPRLLGLRYQTVLSDNSYTGIQSNSKGRGAICYIESPSGKKVRVDTYLIPIKELSKNGLNKIRLCYWGYSTEGALSALDYMCFNSTDFDSHSIASFVIPRESYQDYFLQKGLKFNTSSVPTPTPSIPVKPTTTPSYTPRSIPLPATVSPTPEPIATTAPAPQVRKGYSYEPLIGKWNESPENSTSNYTGTYEFSADKVFTVTFEYKTKEGSAINSYNYNVIEEKDRMVMEYMEKDRFTNMTHYEIKIPYNPVNPKINWTINSKGMNRSGFTILKKINN